MKRGFTIVELLIVILVIAILIGIALPRFKGMQDEANITKAKGELRTLQTALESFYMHNNNSYPSALSNLTSASPNIISSIPTDPFSPLGDTYGYDLGGTNDKFYVGYSVGPTTLGSATIVNDTVSEINGTSCIYISNAGQDTQP